MLFRRKKKDTPAPGATETRLRQLKVPVDLLRTGMHVAKPDRPWTDIPVLFQRFTIDTERQIAMLRHYCQWVIVEVEDTIYRELAPRAQALFRPRLKALPEQLPLIEELPRAEKAFRNTQSFVDSLLEDVRWDRPLSLDQARPVIDQCVESMLANANAMFWLGRIRHQDAYTAEHCLRVAVLACRKAPPEEEPESAAFLVIDELSPGTRAERVFSGWMFASSPALSALAHPVYDVWVLDCKNSKASASSSPQ